MTHVALKKRQQIHVPKTGRCDGEDGGGGGRGKSLEKNTGKGIVGLYCCEKQGKLSINWDHTHTKKKRGGRKTAEKKKKNTPPNKKKKRTSEEQPPPTNQRKKIKSTNPQPHKL